MSCIVITLDALPELKWLMPVSRKMEESLTIRLSHIYIDLMDEMIQKGLYGSKSEIIREALRLLFEKYGEKVWEKEI